MSIEKDEYDRMLADVVRQMSPSITEDEFNRHYLTLRSVPLGTFERVMIFSNARSAEDKARDVWEKIVDLGLDPYYEFKTIRSFFDYDFFDQSYNDFRVIIMLNPMIERRILKAQHDKVGLEKFHLATWLRGNANGVLAFENDEAVVTDADRVKEDLFLDYCKNTMNLQWADFINLKYLMTPRDIRVDERSIYMSILYFAIDHGYDLQGYSPGEFMDFLSPDMTRFASDEDDYRSRAHMFYKNRMILENIIKQVGLRAKIASVVTTTTYANAFSIEQIAKIIAMFRHLEKHLNIEPFDHCLSRILLCRLRKITTRHLGFLR